jgi:hypothetical protein
MKHIQSSRNDKLLRQIIDSADGEPEILEQSIC